MEERLDTLVNVEVCFTPALFGDILTAPPFTVVVVDILRATTSICTAFHQGVREIIPVARLEDARRLKAQGYLVAAERDGQILDFADMGNSALDFLKMDLKGKSIVYSTTNGTQAIMQASNLGQVVIGAFSNISVLTKWLINQRKPVVILCAGWKGKFNLEDAFFAGALTERLIGSGIFAKECDAATAAIAIWQAGKADPLGFMEEALHRKRLKRLGLDDVLPYSFEMDTAPVLPVMHGGMLVNLV